MHRLHVNRWDPHPRAGVENDGHLSHRFRLADKVELLKEVVGELGEDLARTGYCARCGVRRSASPAT